MANYCDNELIITGNQSDIDDFISRIKDSEKEVHFETLLPIPKDIENSSDWYYKNYGISCSGGNNSFFQDNYIFFQTRWVPPLNFFDDASKLYPYLTFELTYWQTEEACCGIVVHKNGERLRDEEDETRSQFARDIFGDEFIDEFFEYEQEENENE